LEVGQVLDLIRKVRNELFKFCEFWCLNQHINRQDDDPAGWRKPSWKDTLIDSVVSCSVLTRMNIASCSQDRRVIVWNIKETDEISFTPEILHVFSDVVWHVSWNFAGDTLSASGGDNQVRIVAQTGNHFLFSCCVKYKHYFSERPFSFPG